MKEFNTTGICLPNRHYMVDLTERCLQIKKMVDSGKYFCINRGRQYGKSTTLKALKKLLSAEYSVFSISFESISDETYATIDKLGKKFISILYEEVEDETVSGLSIEASELLKNWVEEDIADSREKDLKIRIKHLCRTNTKGIVLMIDEVDQASNFPSFLKFLGILRDLYLKSDETPTFLSVILAGVYNIKNLKLKLRPEQEHQYNSPWNIAADFDIDMSLSESGIAAMLQEYEADHHTGMDVRVMAGLIHFDTEGYPFLVSRLCQIMDAKLVVLEEFSSLNECWTKKGLLKAESLLLLETNTLFDDISKKLDDFQCLRELLKTILIEGKTVSFSPYEQAQNMALMFNFIKNINGKVAISNRLFEILLYNMFIQEQSHNESLVEVFQKSVAIK